MKRGTSMRKHSSWSAMCAYWATQVVFSITSFGPLGGVEQDWSPSVTMMVEEPEIPFHHAVIWVSPVSCAVTTPSPPTAATFGFEAIQVTPVAVIVCPSSSRAMSLNWSR
jgi:hypothetical protein